MIGTMHRGRAGRAAMLGALILFSLAVPRVSEAAGEGDLGPPARAPITFGDAQRPLPDPIRGREMERRAAEAVILAGRWRMGVWFGFSHAEMEDLNRAEAELMADWRSTMSNAAGEATEAHGALEFGGELGYRVFERFGAGMRLGGQAGAESLVRVSARDPASGPVGGTYSMTTYVYPVLFGVWGESGDVGGVHTRVSLFVGPAYVSGVCQAKGVLPAWHLWYRPGDSASSLLAQRRSVNYSANVSGSGLAFENGLEIAMPVSRVLAWYVDLGYRWATVERMRLDGDVDMDGNGSVEVGGGAVVSHSDGRPVEFSFGGIRLFTGLRMTM